MVKEQANQRSEWKNGKVAAASGIDTDDEEGCVLSGGNDPIVT